MRKPLRYTLVTLTVVAVGIQFAKPARTNPSVDPPHTVQARTSLPPDVEKTLRRACFDCHSNETRWPWYSHVAPASWLVTYDVNSARQFVNFSQWDQVTGRRAQSRLDTICDEVTQGGMPLFYYLWMHHDARLSADDVKSICAWTASEQNKPALH